jgi:hypothetical protein
LKARNGCIQGGQVLPQKKKFDHGKDGLFNVNMQTKPEARHLN